MQQDKLLINMTCPEFIEALRQGLGLGDSDPSTTQEMDVKKHYVYGRKGIANLLNCSIATVDRIKGSGVLDPAIYQIGHTIITDADLALDLLRVSNKRVGKRLRNNKNKEK